MVQLRESDKLKCLRCGQNLSRPTMTFGTHPILFNTLPGHIFPFASVRHLHSDPIQVWEAIEGASHWGDGQQVQEDDCHLQGGDGEDRQVSAIPQIYDEYFWRLFKRQQKRCPLPRNYPASSGDGSLEIPLTWKNTGKILWVRSLLNHLKHFIDHFENEECLKGRKEYR